MRRRRSPPVRGRPCRSTCPVLPSNDAPGVRRCVRAERPAGTVLAAQLRQVAVTDAAAAVNPSRPAVPDDDALAEKAGLRFHRHLLGESATDCPLCPTEPRQPASRVVHPSPAPCPSSFEPTTSQGVWPLRRVLAAAGSSPPCRSRCWRLGSRVPPSADDQGQACDVAAARREGRHAQRTRVGRAPSSACAPNRRARLTLLRTHGLLTPRSPNWRPRRAVAPRYP